jgi:hypothetical protein
MTIVFTVVVILATALEIETASHPVARALYALSTPVSPDAKLRIAKPFWGLVCFE